MCGILGLYPFKFQTQIDQQVKTFIQRWLFVEALVSMETRGKDATGVGILWKDSKTAVVKQPVASSFFAINDGCVKEEYKDPKDDRATFGWLVRKWKSRLDVADIAQVIGHVRAKTKGSEYDPHNNHPIIIFDSIKDKDNPHIGDNAIIGVHNGIIRNDDDLTKKYNFSRLGEVDSEIIFQMLNKHKENLNIETLSEVFDEVAGMFAVLAYNTSKPNLVYGLREDRPIEIGYIPQIGCVVAVSERTFIDNALTSFDRWRVREDNEEKFPYVNIKWMKAIDTGVFTMDLDTEVTEETAAESLITFKKIIKKTVTAATNTKTGWENYYNKPASTATTPAQQPIPLPPATPSKPVVDKRSAIVHDETDYSEPAADAIPNGIIPLTDEGSSLEVEVVIEDEEAAETMGGIVSDEDDETGFTFMERMSFGSEFFTTQILTEDRIEKEMFLAKPIDEQQAILEKYGIKKVKTTEEMKTICDILYDIVFPEGYAFGYTDGYLACDDENSHSENAKKIEELEKKLDRFRTIAKAQKKKLDEQKTKTTTVK